MLNVNNSDKLMHIYVMLSVDGLVKVGISENVIKRSYSEYLEGEKKQIIDIYYSAEKFDVKTARIYEAAILGLHRRYIINNSEWLTDKWEKVTETFYNMFDGKTKKVKPKATLRADNALLQYKSLDENAQSLFAAVLRFLSTQYGAGENLNHC